ncbi:hypothetical protein V6N12_007032 [Hibiscus sabdariffa]|uniref:RNase H type-1 domain-containing protein n=1 Tax=Hibiscus sabdariffa TaxID=183260 RepID=A0ABR2F0M4_9ROSI
MNAGVNAIFLDTVNDATLNPSCNVGTLPLSIKCGSCSRLWTGLQNVWDDICESINWSIGDGAHTNFWFDHWLGNYGRLAFSCIADPVPASTMVMDMVTISGEWDWDRLSMLLPSDCLDRIAADNSETGSQHEDILTRGNRLAAEYAHGFAPSTRQLSIGSVPPRSWSRPVPGFTRSIGVCYALVAELWAVHDMLACAWRENFHQIILETDCFEIIRILSHTSRALVSDGLVKVILEWTQREWKLVVRHVSRDCNHLADRIAASGRTTSRSGMVIADSPASLAALVEEEADRVLVDSNMVAWVRDGHTACFNMVDTRVDSAFWFLFLGLFLL